MGKIYGKTSGHHCFWLTINGKSVANFDNESDVDDIVALGSTLEETERKLLIAEEKITNLNNSKAVIKPDHFFKISDVVVPNNSMHGLVSGSRTYPHAIVVSETPFVIASDDGSMRWESTISPRNFSAVGSAQESTMKKCLHRAKS